MKNLTAICADIFKQVIDDYHAMPAMLCEPERIPFEGDLERLLYKKCWIDTAQWHMEDEVRRPEITAEEGFGWKKRIDKQNQLRTDTVEQIDDWFLNYFTPMAVPEKPRLNTESMAWAIDRLSILALKIYHMAEEADRKTGGPGHVARCTARLNLLNEQWTDLTGSIDELVEDIMAGRKYMKVYRQVKMYNDKELNPALYGK